ncbi:MAG: NUDIX hydrolase [Propionibacteriales bacterium]|nr:NUDIX hydrolase [Propionibacteriales bacterium]
MVARDRAIAAAGAVVLRGTGRRRAVAMIRQERYGGEWTLPKGTLEAKEPAPVAAVREVLEETGLTIRLGHPLDRISYESPRGPKVVDWWVGHVLDQAPRTADDEVDEVAFVPVTEARRRLSHEAHRHLLDQALTAPATTPLLVVRHAKAMSRVDWARADGDGEEATRPLTTHGRRQAQRLARLLSAYGVLDLSSSPWRRCVATLTPYARHLGTPVITIDELTETRTAADPQATRIAIARLREQASRSGRPAAVCIHRPTIPDVLTALDLPWRHFGTTHCAVIHLGSDGTVEASEPLRHG